MTWRGWCAWVGATLVGGCAQELPPASAEDVQDALARDFLAPMRDVLVAAWPSDCRTEGETDAPVSAALFAAFLEANASDAPSSALLPDSATARLRVDASGRHPSRVSAERGEPVIAVSHAGVSGDDALVCVEVFGVQERAFFVVLGRDRAGDWSARTELEVWTELAPEELPDGELYR